MSKKTIYPPKKTNISDVSDMSSKIDLSSIVSDPKTKEWIKKERKKKFNYNLLS